MMHEQRPLDSESHSTLSHLLKEAEQHRDRAKSLYEQTLRRHQEEAANGD